MEVKQKSSRSTLLYCSSSEKEFRSIHSQGRTFKGGLGKLRVWNFSWEGSNKVWNDFFFCSHTLPIDCVYVPNVTNLAELESFYIEKDGWCAWYCLIYGFINIGLSTNITVSSATLKIWYNARNRVVSLIRPAKIA